MPNLESSIADWRQQMLAAGIKNPVPLEELESHLRDEIEQLEKAGLSGTEAFQTAVQKIGLAQVVQDEFKKVEVAKADRQWKWKQFLLLGFSMAVPLMMGTQLFYFKPESISEMTPGQKTSCLAALLTFSMLAWCGRWGHQLFPVIQAKRSREVVLNSGGVALGLWWIVLLNFIVPQFVLTMSQFLIVLLWGFLTPTGVWIGVCLGMEIAARRPNRITAA